MLQRHNINNLCREEHGSKIHSLQRELSEVLQHRKCVLFE